MRKSTLSALLLLIILLFTIQAACLLGGSAETPEPVYLVITNTAPPPTPTPQPVLTIDVSPYPYPDLCPQAQSVTLYSDTDIVFGEVNYITIPAGQPVFARLLWVASTQEILEQNAQYISFTLAVDGIPLQDQAYLAYTDIYGSIHAPEGYAPAVSYGIALAAMQAGETHTVEITRTNSVLINDGIDDYPAGDTTVLTYVISAANIPKR